MSAPTCSECGRVLLVSSGFQMCCWTRCSEFGKPIDTKQARRTKKAALR